MLVVTRKIGEQIQIGDQITVTITRVDQQQVRIGIVAPAGVPIVRAELIDATCQAPLPPGEGLSSRPAARDRDDRR